MDTKELRSFSEADLTARVRQWKEELFRARFQVPTGEKRDTTTRRKLRRDVARALTVLRQQSLPGAVATAPAPGVEAAAVAAPKKKASKAKATAPKAKKPAKKA